MSDLEYRVRAIAADADLPASVSNDRTNAADAIAITRSERLNAAARDLPTPLFLLAFLSGAVLALNAIVLALHLDHAHGVAIGGIVALIPLDLALLLAIALPFDGDLRVEGPRSTASSTTSRENDMDHSDLPAARCCPRPDVAP